MTWTFFYSFFSLSVYGYLDSNGTIFTFLSFLFMCLLRALSDALNNIYVFDGWLFCGIYNGMINAAAFRTWNWTTIAFENNENNNNKITGGKMGKNQPVEHIGEKYKRDWPQLAPYYSTASAESNIRRTLYRWLYKEKLSAAGYINICCDNANPQYWKRSEIATGTYMQRYNNSSRRRRRRGGIHIGYFMERLHVSTFARISMLFSRIFYTAMAFGNRHLFFSLPFWAIKSMNRMFGTSSYCTTFTHNTRSIHWGYFLNFIACLYVLQFVLFWVFYFPSAAISICTPNARWIVNRGRVSEWVRENIDICFDVSMRNTGLAVRYVYVRLFQWKSHFPISMVSWYRTAPYSHHSLFASLHLKLAASIAFAFVRAPLASSWIQPTRSERVN